MPTYEYACLSCGTHIDVYQSYRDEPLDTCRVCGGRLRKVFHPAGILFKGSGFYVTDSRAGKDRAGTAGDASGDGKKSESGGESKKEAAAAGTSGRAETATGAGTAGGDGGKSAGSKEKSG